MSHERESVNDAHRADTSAALVQVLLEQQRMAQGQYQRVQEQQAVQQEVLMKLVEQQREEMARCREEM